MSAISVERQFTGMDTLIRFETGLLAPQAHGAVVARLGETMVLATATTSKQPKDGVDFFPLTVDVEERMYAAGKIPGSFFRREGRASDQAILTCRLIDRPLRPCFPDGFRNDVHVVVTILGADLVNPHDVLSINAASAALMMSGIPFEGPIGAVRIALAADGHWIPFPTYQEGDESSFELVVAGRMTSDGSDVAVMMVEAGGTEATWQAYETKGAIPTEEVVAAGLVEAKRWIRESIELQKEMIAKATPREPMVWSPVRDYSDEIAEAVASSARDRLVQANAIADKVERANAIEAVNTQVQEELASRFEGEAGAIKAALRSLLKQVVRERIVNDGVRIDGRDTVTIRPLSAAVGLIPTAHGSGLFQRGETQVLNICTLGMPRMNQLLDTLGVDESKRYMHHYNMPPFASGEPGFMRGPKRREIGHGLLAERALLPVVPSEDEFSYALRLVSEVLSSNGSTSMASVCGSTLSLMDAGVPIKAPVGGIAMGLIYEGGKYITLTDILGAEDAFGDMDFKVAGTREFVTALQLDTKIDGIPAEVLASALKQAHTARMQIIDVIEAALPAPRSEVAATAPRIVTMQIPMDKIGEIIGPKGKNINALQLETGCDISVDDDGTVGRVVIGSRDGAMVKEVQRRIELILNPPEATLGAIYNGKVVGITKFGAFVNILPGRDGLVHISKLGRGRRVERVEDVLELNQEVNVRVDEIDPSGKLALSLVDEGSTVVEEVVTSEPRAERKPSTPSVDPSKRVSFEDSFESELAREIGDLG
ncbi:polyribonucleotide nucleotidyltransferase [Ferrimicrobium sp.]|uniref:polyribonucleotide nucleotidyltransferase n=1 Tax=Ferrimicrobium sp. TaxID=2926050 RepID=UPI00262713F1|nr:polyribonucleotide nucleotidyltransferase [Ferrimicrobium sp.]